MIRRATREDLAGLVLLEKECFEGYYNITGFSRADFIDYLECEGAVLLVAVRSRSMVGYVAGVVPSPDSRELARVDSVAVSRKARGTGVGTRLVERFIERARREGCRGIAAEVAEPNEESLRLFERLGFRRTRRLHAYYGHGVDGIRMRRALP
ncbi:MAG: GNAT family N-acetyltransferase [Planctomycetota bacterium]